MGNNGKPNKLHTNFTGPYTIEARDKELYALRSSSGRLQNNVSVHLLKPYVYDKMRNNPDLEGLHDNESYLVEKILSHRGTFTKKKQLNIEVKWEGFDEPTFVPWKNVMYNTHMHQYMRDNGLEKHIPPSIEPNN